MVFFDNFEKYSNSDKFNLWLDRAFENRKVLELFRDEISNDSNFGIYPGPVNNLFIIDFKDCLVDPDLDELHTNTYIKKGLREDEHFLYLNESNWSIVKQFFGYTYEIERKTVNLADNTVIEVNLRKLKILILDNKMSREDINLIKPRYIQMSKAKKIKDLKAKILRSVNPVIVGKEETEKGMDHNIKLYLFNFGLKEKKKETFELMFAFKNKDKGYKLQAEEIKDDEILLEVK